MPSEREPGTLFSLCTQRSLARPMSIRIEMCERRVAWHYVTVSLLLPLAFEAGL